LLIVKDLRGGRGGRLRKSLIVKDL